MAVRAPAIAVLFLLVSAACTSDGMARSDSATSGSPAPPLAPATTALDPVDHTIAACRHLAAERVATDWIAANPMGGTSGSGSEPHHVEARREHELTVEAMHSGVTALQALVDPLEDAYTRGAPGSYEAVMEQVFTVCLQTR